MRSILTGLLFLALATPALATDGVIEINQASTGGTFPEVLSSPGSYRLTSDLVVSNTASGVWITASDVTLDLNGFAIRSSSSAGNGILINSATNVEIRNGTIRGFDYGIFMSSSELIRVINVRALDNATYGLLTQGSGSLVRGCTVARNGTGIRGFTGSLIVENVVHDNTLDGMVLNDVAYGSNVLNGNGTDLNVNRGVVVSPNQCGTGSC